jgi:hypothetical protein
MLRIRLEMSATQIWSRPVGVRPRVRLGRSAKPCRLIVVRGTNGLARKLKRLSSRIKRSTRLALTILPSRFSVLAMRR